MKRQNPKRMSIRAVANTYGIPARTVARAVTTGVLPSVRTTTETGRERCYISPDDAATWVDTLVVIASRQGA